MTVIGTAEIVVHANTAGFASEVEAQTAPAFKAVETEAAVAGQRSGAALATGVKAGTTEAGASASGLGAIVRKATLGIGAALIGTAAIGVHMADGMQRSEAAIASATHTSVAGAHEISKALLGTAGQSEFTGAKMEEAYAKVAGQMKATEGRTLDAKQATEFMTAASDLAVAKQIDLGQATSTTAMILQAFNLKTKDAAHVTDVLYSASNATGVEVGVLGSQLQRLRGRLGETGGSVGGLATTLVDMTKHGITGRAAMSALSGGLTTVMKSSSAVTNAVQEQNRAWAGLSPDLQRLVKSYQDGTTSTKDFNAAVGKLLPSQQAAVKGFLGASQAADKAKSKFHDLGIEVFDQQGKFVGMGSIIEQLAPKFAHMTQAQKLATAETIFGAGAAKQMVTIIEAGPAAYDAASRAVERHGAVTSAAATQSQTFHGELKTLEAAAGDLATQIGLVVVPALTTVIGVFADATHFALQHKAVLVALGVVAGALAAKFVYTKAVAAISILGDALAAVVGTMRTLAVTAVAGWSALGAVGKFAATAGAIGVVVGAIALFTGHQKSAQQATEDLNNALNQQRDALRAVRDLDLNAADAKLQARQSALAVADALDTYNAALAKSGKSSRAAKEAEVQYSQAIIQHQRDLRALSDVQGNATSTTQKARQAIKDAAQAEYDHIEATKGINAALAALPAIQAKTSAALGRLTGSANTAKSATIGVKTALGQLPSDTNSTVNVDTTQAITNIAALKSEIDSAVNSAITLGNQISANANKKLHHEGSGTLRFSVDPYSNQTGYAGGVSAPGGHGAVVAFESSHSKKTPLEKAQDLVTQQKAALEKWISDAKANTKDATASQKAELDREIIEKRAALAIQTRAELNAASKQTAEQKAVLRQRIQQEAAEQRKGQSLINSLLTAIHSHSLKTIQNALFQAHLHGLKDIEIQLKGSHDKALKALGAELVKVHSKALAEQTKQKKISDDAATAKYAQAVADALAKADQDAATVVNAATKRSEDVAAGSVKAIQDATKVTLDQTAEKTQQSSIDQLQDQLKAAQAAGQDTKVLTSQIAAAQADLVGQQAQTALDTLTQSWDATINTAQLAVDDASTGTATAQANAAQALATAQNSASIAEAQQQATLEIDQALATAADAAATAAQQAASDTTTPTPTDGGGAATPTVPAAQFNFTINGHGMTAADLFAEVGWALKTGALPIGSAS